MPVDLGSLNRELVLENNVVFGTVNATAGTTRWRLKRSVRLIAAGSIG